MSYIFKSNSRFSTLIDDISEEKNNLIRDKQKKMKSDINIENKEPHFNLFKSERNIKTETKFIDFNDNRRKNYKSVKIDEIMEIEKEKINQEILNNLNFPELVNIPKKEVIDNNVDNTKMNYIEKLKKDNFVENFIDPDLENLKPGWVLFKRDPLTRQIIIKNHPKTFIEEKQKESKKTDQEIMTDIIIHLSKLYEKRTEEYIENYGYDEWERMFKFPDWKEREAWLEKMEEIENNSHDSESEYEDEEYN